MTNKKAGNLLYRASRDGFKSTDFHYKCDGKTNTVAIVKNNLNYVFGGYTSNDWGEDCEDDKDAFIFSLRRNGISTNGKYVVINSEHAIDPSLYSLFSFGFDITICSKSNTKTGSYANFGLRYELPEGLTFGSDSAKNFLSGNFNKWLSTEIEVFQLVWMRE